MVREVLRYPHPDLKRVCSPAADLDETHRIVADLLDTMHSCPHCVGLAAPQIGELVRIVVVDVTAHPKATRTNGLVVLVDPVVVDAEGREVGREGCLSIPELTANVERATRVRVEARDGDARHVTVEALGFEARAIQHELDHLDGVLFLDRIATISDLFPRRRRTSGANDA